MMPHGEVLDGKLTFFVMVAMAGCLLPMQGCRYHVVVVQSDEGNSSAGASDGRSNSVRFVAAARP
jgi:hypothetical protein